jgi:hypothetical protein
MMLYIYIYIYIYIYLLFKDYFLFILQLIEVLGFYIKKIVLTRQLDMDNNAISALCTCNLIIRQVLSGKVF